MGKYTDAAATVVSYAGLALFFSSVLYLYGILFPQVGTQIQVILSVFGGVFTALIVGIAVLFDRIGRTLENIVDNVESIEESLSDD